MDLGNSGNDLFDIEDPTGAYVAGIDGFTDPRDVGEYRMGHVPREAAVHGLPKQAAACFADIEYALFLQAGAQKKLWKNWPDIERCTNKSALARWRRFGSMTLRPEKYPDWNKPSFRRLCCECRLGTIALAHTVASNSNRLAGRIAVCCVYPRSVSTSQKRPQGGYHEAVGN